MADQKRWFKVWTSILDDPHFQELPLEDIGRWALLGAMCAMVGSRGRLRSPAGARRLREVIRTESVDMLKTVLKTLPNVLVEEGQNRHGEFTVTMMKWNKYQEDSTQAERAKASRSKRREEEKRGEERRREPPIVPQSTNGHEGRSIHVIALDLLAFLNRKAQKNFQGGKRTTGFIEARLRSGATEAQCRAIIGIKCNEWRDSPKMRSFLRPLTIFNETNFAQYLGELPASAFEPETDDD